MLIFPTCCEVGANFILLRVVIQLSWCHLLKRQLFPPLNGLRPSKSLPCSKPALCSTSPVALFPSWYLRSELPPSDLTSCVAYIFCFSQPSFVCLLLLVWETTSCSKHLEHCVSSSLCIGVHCTSLPWQSLRSLSLFLSLFPHGSLGNRI